MNRTHAPLALALALFLSATLARPAAADPVLISSTDPSIDTSATSNGFANFHGVNTTAGVSFTVNQVSMLDSIVADITPNINPGDTASLTAQLLEIGAPENDQYGTPSYQYTLVGTSAPSIVSGEDLGAPVQQTITFSGEELDPGNTYLIVLNASFQHNYESFSWEYTSSSAYATSYGSIGMGIWEYTVNGSTPLVYDNVSNFTPELTIYADVAVPEPSSLVLAAVGLATAGLAARRRVQRRQG